MTIYEYFKHYKDELNQAMGSVELLQIDSAMRLIKETRGVIYVGGNGGSCAISNHLCCDMSKGLYPQLKKKVVSLSCNTPLITAIANDLGYEKTLAYQLDLLLSPKDLVILISSSGNSPNIVNAAQAAKSMGVPVIGFTGFTGGELKKLCEVNLHVSSKNYGIIEDCHQSFMHIISQYLKQASVS